MLDKLKSLVYNKTVKSSSFTAEKQNGLAKTNEPEKRKAEDAYAVAMENMRQSSSKHKRITREVEKIQASGTKAIEDFLDGLHRLD